MVEPGCLAEAGRILAPYSRDGRFCVVTDDQVADAVLPLLQAGLEQGSIGTKIMTLPAGEATKSWDWLARLCDWLIENGVERGDHVIALGGGVIGDLTGFACSILKRGCGFIQIPTTLLAQVDSSVGGKTAINTEAGKNLIGTFHQPSLVLIDPQVLDTLPDRQCRAGYAEVVKYGLIGDPGFFDWCEANGLALLNGDRKAQVFAIEASVRAKARIVEDDERERLDRRALLNLGHTFGHALEAETGFGNALLHGEAVAAGMALAFRFSARRGICPEDDASRVAAHLRSVGLPDGLRAAGVSASGTVLVSHMLHDKKMSAGTLPFILARGIGHAYVDKSVSLSDVESFLDTEAR
jgi:3-dehydroquinate synthase